MENKLTAYEFAKKVNKHPTQIMRDVDSGKTKGMKVKVNKMEYQIPVTELEKYGIKP